MNQRTSQPLVSIITPAYNEADYIAECIESVLGQTYQNWDYTIVNNCSTDKTLEIAERYAAKDSRIRIYNNPALLRINANHNVAFRQISADSRYCKVVFADDWLFSDCLERMVSLAEAHPSVGIVGAYGLQREAVLWTGLPYPSTVVSGRDVLRLWFLKGKYVCGAATAHMIRSDLVRSRNPFYNESNLHADSETCFEVLRTSDFGFVHQILTYTREPRAESLRTTAFDLNVGLACGLRELLKHGPSSLTPDEMDVCLRSHMSGYYKFLGESLLQGKSKKFWEYHRKKLDEIGVGLSRIRVATAVCMKAANALLNPKLTLENLFRGRNILQERFRGWKARHASPQGARP